MRRLINWFRARQFDREVRRARRFLSGYNAAMISLGIPRHERKRRLRELIELVSVER